MLGRIINNFWRRKEEKSVEIEAPKTTRINIDTLDDLTELIGESLENSIDILSSVGSGIYNEDTGLMWGYYNEFRNCLNGIIEPRYLVRDVRAMLEKMYPGNSYIVNAIVYESYEKAISCVIKEKEDKIKEHWDSYVEQLKQQHKED